MVKSLIQIDQWKLLIAFHESDWWISKFSNVLLDNQPVMLKYVVSWFLVLYWKVCIYLPLLMLYKLDTYMRQSHVEIAGYFVAYLSHIAAF